MLEIGTKAPNFTLKDKDGKEVSLSDFLGKKVVLYFYPKDNTPGCTRQACAFAAAYEGFKSKDVAVIGLPDSRLGEIAAAIVELKPDFQLSEEEFNNFCLALPRYQRPRKVIFAEVPRNPTGKIEKPKLRRMYGADQLVAQQNGLKA